MKSNWQQNKIMTHTSPNVISIIPLGPNFLLPSLHPIGPLMNSNVPSKLSASGSSKVVMLSAVKCTSTSLLVDVYSTGKSDVSDELHTHPRCSNIESW